MKEEAGAVIEKGVVWQVAPDGRVISRRDATRANVFAQHDGVLGTFFVDLHARCICPIRTASCSPACLASPCWPRRYRAC